MNEQHTHQDMINKQMLDALSEELDDIAKYNDIYEKACEAGEYDTADLVEKIARDEYAHAQGLWKCLKKKNAYDPHHHSHIEEKWHKANEIFGVR